MFKISEKPWDNMNLVYDGVMAGHGFKYLEKNYLVIYEEYISKKDEILMKYEKDGNWDKYIEIETYNRLFIILGCAMIELWVNSFGIQLLNEKYYQKNIERMGIIEKIKILLAIHKKIEMEDNDIIKNIRKLFDYRNSLVHPKAKKVTSKNIEKYAFNPYNFNNDDYIFVKQTLKDAQIYFHENEIMPNDIDYI
jgi:hypothetical protein